MSISLRLFPLLLLLLAQLQATQAIWFPWYFHRYGFEPHSNRHSGAAKGPPAAATGSKGKGTATGAGAGTGVGAGAGTTSTSKPGKAGSDTCPPGYQLKGRDTVTCPPGYQLKGKGAIMANSRLCDDNPLVMQLARLYVVSPERIVLLLAQPLLMESCEEVNDVLDHIRSVTSNCILADDNIYGRLADGLRYYKEEVCDGGTNKKRSTSLNEAHGCLKELRTDMIECEAAADWYERRNATKVCQTFNDVLDCYYTRSAMLCGLEAAKQLRSFAGDSMKRAMIHSCEVSKRLPPVTDPMPVFAAASHSSLSFWLLAYCLLQAC